MPRDKDLFPYSRVYPRNQEELADKLPDLALTAGDLFPALMECAFTSPSARTRARHMKHLGGGNYDIRRPEDAEGIRELIRERDSGSDKRLDQEVVFPLDGHCFHVRRADYPHEWPGGYYITANFVKLSDGVSQDDYFELPARYFDTHVDPIHVNYGAYTNGGEELIRFNLSGKSRIDAALGFSIQLDMTKGVEESDGPPTVYPDATVLNPEQKVVADEYGLYGLVYHEALGRLQLMNNIIEGRIKV